MLNANLIIHPGSYTNLDAIKNAIQYIFRIPNGYHFIYGAYPPTEENIIDLFERLRNHFSENTCEQQLQHFCITFEDCQNIEFINYFSSQVADLFIHNYPVCFALHDDKPNLHIHFVVSTTSYCPGVPPLIDSTWKDFERKLFPLASQYGISLQRITKYV